jgi:hypothetical protein
LSGLSAIMSLGASAVVLGVGAVVGAGWLRIWVPRHDPTRGARTRRTPGPATGGP